MRSEETVKDVGMRELTLNSISIVKGEYGGGFSAVEYDPKKPRYIRITDINDEGELNQNVVAPSGTDTDWNKYALSYGDLLFARSGATVGKTFLYDKQYGNCIYAGYLIRFRINQEIAFPKFIYYFTKSTKYNAWVKSKQNVVAQPNINAQQYGNELKIPLPPLSEQKRIAELLDAADNLRKKDKALLEKYDQLAQSLFLELFGDPVKNEKGWEVKKIDDFSDLVTKGSSPNWQGFEYLDQGVRFITSENVRLGFLDCRKDKFVANEFHNLLNRSKLKENDLLVNLVGASIGRGALVTKEVLPANINQAVAKIEFTNLINPIFALNQMITPQIQESLIGNKVEGARANISLQNVKELQFIYPPLILQNQFAEQVQLIEKQKEIAKQNLEKSEELMKGLMGSVFG